MLAVIFRTPEDDRSSILPIAGRPLVVRQLQYLRAIGVRRVAVEHAVTLPDADVRAWLVDEALATTLELVPTRHPVGAREVARRADFPDDEVVIALPTSALLDAEIAPIVSSVVDGAPTRVLAPPPETAADTRGAFALRHAEITIARRASDLAVEPRATVASGGWGARVRTHADALRVGAAALDGALPARTGQTSSIPIHASEREPGVWLGRGASVAADAKLIRPVLIAPGAVVRSGACVGPHAIVSEGAVVEQGARVATAVVLPNTVVGEGLAIVDIVAGGDGIVELESGDHVPIEDEAILTRRGATRSAYAASRVVAVLLVVALLPVALVLALVDVAAGRAIARRTRRHLDPVRRSGLLATWIRLLDVPAGRRALVGVTLSAPDLGALARVTKRGARTDALVAEAERATVGAIAIDDALTPFDRSAEARLRAMAWYARAKSLREDIALLRGTMRRAPPNVERLLVEERITLRPPGGSLRPLASASEAVVRVPRSLEPRAEEDASCSAA